MRLRVVIVFCCFLIPATTIGRSPGERLKSEQDAWVEANIDALVASARAAYDSDKALPHYKKVVDGIASAVGECKLSDDEDFVSRHREFIDYVEATSLGYRSDHELGFNVPDKQYFTETSKYVQIPDFLMDQGFLRSVSRYETLDRAKAYLRRLNLARDPSDQLTFFSYISRHLGTPDNDNSFRRLLIVVPGSENNGGFDKWVQFGVTDPGKRVRVRNVSVVAAVTKPDGTFDSYFKDFFRTYRRTGSITATGRWELGEGDDNCALCHKTGILPIFPEAGSVRRSELPEVEAVNQRFLTYGSPRFGKYLDETKFGPGLGTKAPAEIPARIHAAKTQVFNTESDATAVDRAMTCSECHQHGRLGALNWPMDPVLLNSYITGGQMPLGDTLTASERDQLYTRLIDQYFAVDDAKGGVLKSWLRGKLR